MSRVDAAKEDRKERRWPTVGLGKVRQTDTPSTAPPEGPTDRRGENKGCLHQNWVLVVFVRWLVTIFFHGGFLKGVQLYYLQWGAGEDGGQMRNPGNNSNVH